MSRSAIVRGGYIANRSTRSRRTYQPIRRMIHYIAYGRHAPFATTPPELRGEWVDQVMRQRTHADVLQWAKQQVHQAHHPHAYQLLLSTRYGELSAADFHQALVAGQPHVNVSAWRMMVHTDTDHQHAHVVLFRQHKLAKHHYLQWQQTLQETLEAQHAARWSQLSAEANVQQQADNAIELEAATTDALTPQSQHIIEGWL